MLKLLLIAEVILSRNKFVSYVISRKKATNYRIKFSAKNCEA